MSMNIAPVIPVVSAVIPAVKFDALLALDASSSSTSLLGALSLPDASASMVNFSTLAQLLAATVVFQAQEAQQAQAVLAGTLTSSDFSQLSATATFFVDAFNRFQTSVDSLMSPLSSSFDSGFLLAIHTQNVQTGSDHAQSFIDSLAQVGINFQEATDLSNPNQFKIDLTALEAAFTANPEQTTSLLANALKGLSAIEAKLLASETQLNLNLFASDIVPAVQELVPASQFDINLVTAQLGSLSNTDAQIVNSALQQLLADEALSAAIDANPISPQTETPPVIVGGQSSASTAENLPVENPNFVLNGINFPPADRPGFASLTAAQIADAGNLNLGPVLPNFPSENGNVAALSGNRTESAAATQTAANSAQPATALSPAESGVNAVAPTASNASISTISGSQVASAASTQAAASSTANSMANSIANSAADSAIPSVQGGDLFSLAADQANQAGQASIVANSRAVTEATTSANPANLLTRPVALTPTVPGLKRPVISGANASQATPAVTTRPAIVAQAESSGNSANEIGRNLGNTENVISAVATSAGSTTVATNPFNSSIAGLAALADQAIPQTLASKLGQTTLSSTEAPASSAPAHPQAMPINPLIAVAVAAYRIGETIVGTPHIESLSPVTEIIPDVAAIPRIDPVKLDLHDGSSADGRKEPARNSV